MNTSSGKEVMNLKERYIGRFGRRLKERKILCDYSLKTKIKKDIYILYM